MASSAQRVMEILITVGVIWVALYIVEGTFGVAFAQMGVDFGNILTTLHMSSGWHSVAIQEVNQWPQFWNAVTAMILTIGVWGFKGIFISDPYSRYRG